MTLLVVPADERYANDTPSSAFFTPTHPEMNAQLLLQSPGRSVSRWLRPVINSTVLAIGLGASLNSAGAATFVLTKAIIDSIPSPYVNIVDFSKPTIGYGAAQVANTLQPGDTLQIESHTRHTLVLMNIYGTATQKITITNAPGGQFIIDDVTVNGTTTQGQGMALWGAEHVILKGTPTATGAYGIKINHAVGAHALKIDFNHGTEGRFNQPTRGSLDVEVTGLEICNTFFDAIQAKCERNLIDLPAGYVMDKIHIHHNYLHDTGGEGMYIGWATAGDHEDMSNVLIHDNILERCGWDGIQLNRAKTGVNAIYNNTIIGFGLKSNSYNPYYYQAGGMSIGASFVKIYNNFMQAISAPGQEFQGVGISYFLYGHSQIYNNVIILGQYGASVPQDGIYLNQAAPGAANQPPAGTVLDLINNTIIQPDRYGVAIGQNVSYPVKLYNNIVAAPANLGLPAGPKVYTYIEPASTVTLSQSNNLFRPTVGEIAFVNPSAGNFDLTAASPAVDQGLNVASYGITSDVDGVTRPQGVAYDIGAYEYSAGTTVINPVAVGTAVGSAYCPATGAFNAPPVWDSVNQVPVGDDPVPNSGTTTAYASRTWFVDFGTNWAKVRLTSMWTRYRPFSGGNYAGFAQVWWDNDNDNVNDGITVTSTVNFATAQSVAHVAAQLWKRDKDFSAAPKTPQGRYLLFTTSATPTDRPNEFVFIGYTVP